MGKAVAVPTELLAWRQTREKYIAERIDTLWDVASALHEIKNNPDSWKPEFGTWKKYVAATWDVALDWADDMVRAGGVREKLGARPSLPRTVSQARSLARAPDPAEAWERAQKETGKAQPSEREIKRVVRETKARPAPTPSREDRASAFADEVNVSADRFLSAVRAMLPLVDSLSDVEKQAVAYKVVSICNAVMSELQDRGEVTESVVVGVIGEGARRAG